MAATISKLHSITGNILMTLESEESVLDASIDDCQKKVDSFKPKLINLNSTICKIETELSRKKKDRQRLKRKHDHYNATLVDLIAKKPKLSDEAKRITTILDLQNDINVWERAIEENRLKISKLTDDLIDPKYTSLVICLENLNDPEKKILNSFKMCTICLDRKAIKNFVRLIPCGHLMCVTCYHNWMKDCSLEPDRPRFCHLCRGIADMPPLQYRYCIVDGSVTLQGIRNNQPLIYPDGVYEDDVNSLIPINSDVSVCSGDETELCDFDDIFASIETRTISTDL